MKVYIATYYKYNNYGTRLQNYALLKALNNIDIDVVTLGVKDYRENMKKFIKQFYNIIPFSSIKNKWKNDILKDEKFIDFNRFLNIEFFSKKEFKNINKKNVVGIAGSDQIWSPVHLRKNRKDIYLFFLQFLDKNKRYSYAPSFGVSEIPLKYKKMYIENLKNFNEITVRENSGRKIIKDLIDCDVNIMPDPVFLLNKEEWIKNLNLKNKKDNYILTYFLGNESENRENSIREYAVKNNCKIIKIAGNSLRKDDIIPSPIEFLELILNARAIFTDSFHASAFSIIFNKKFFVYKRKDVKQFSRMETLLKKYGMENTIMKDDNTIYEYKEKNNIELLKREKEFGMKYLKNIKIKNEEDNCE